MAVLTRRLWLPFLCLILALPLFGLPRIAYSAASLALPGSGELLLGERTRGGILLGADLLSIYAFSKTGTEINRQRDTYKQYALLYAGVPLNMPQNHYQAIQNYPSSDYYNDIQEMMARNYYLIYNYDPAAYEDYLSRNTYQGNEAWNWQTDAAWQEYKNQRVRHQRTKMSHNLALGIMLFNRVFSSIDSALLSGKKHGTVYLSPMGQEGAMLNYRIDF